MERPTYLRVAQAIAVATNAEQREVAQALLTQYYAIEPPHETTRERMALLREALVAARAAKTT